MSTRGVIFLRQQGIAFELVRYEHRQKGAEFAADAIGFPLAQTIKTLVVDLGDKSFCMALMPGNHQLDLKKIAAVFSVKKASMADTPTAQRLTGYLVGGISPFGTKQKLPSVMETSLMAYDTVAINGGQRGALLKMAPADIVTAIGCRISDISVP